MMARFTTLCGCKQEKDIHGSRSSIPAFFTLPFTNRRIPCRMGPAKMSLRTVVLSRDFELMGFDAGGVAEYLEVER